jgi:hypothetical protein
LFFGEASVRYTMGKYFTCVISGDEIISDSYKNFREIDDFFYECEGEYINVNESIPDSVFGGNPSVEDAIDTTSGIPVERKINVIFNYDLQAVHMDQKTLVGCIKNYVKAVATYLEETNPERVPIFKKLANELIKKRIFSNFNNLEILSGPSYTLDGTLLFQDYREDGVTPYFFVMKDGLKEHKV